MYVRNARNVCMEGVGEVGGVYAPHVVDEVLLAREPLVAVGAGMRHVAGVLAHVVREVLLARERPRAVRALVRSFARMLSAQQSTFRFDFIFIRIYFIYNY